ncbi:GPALPP motifs-containing protein [Favolaschia claudopus]|uniref:GPALPP motifs-containing protein n=1 Tax=Favolaschia claudopus TaxID=2862362 RepID=A0AAW0CE49_9AGAR
MSAIGPAIPSHLLNRRSSNSDSEEEESVRVAGPQPPPPTRNEVDEEDDEDDYAPALPPDMIASSSKKPIAGPTMPPAYPPTYNPRTNYHADDSDDDDIGPRPLPAGVGFEERDAVKEFMAKEERRRQQVEDAAKPKAPKRDEWMLVPPSSSVLGNLDPTKLKARQFARTAAPSRDTDSSLWTETPAERQQRLADEVSGKKRRAANSGDAVSAEEELEARKRQRVDEELRREVEAHTRKTRGSALVDMHSRAGKGEEKDEHKAIWDRDRDMGLGGRLMDDDKRTKMIKEAKGLGDRFATGKTGGFY